VGGKKEEKIENKLHKYYVRTPCVNSSYTLIKMKKKKMGKKLKKRKKKTKEKKGEGINK